MATKMSYTVVMGGVLLQHDTVIAALITVVGGVVVAVIQNCVIIHQNWKIRQKIGRKGDDK